MLECSLIKHYMPKYNILLKDDKGYPYLRLDMREPYPVITLSNRVIEDGAKYFGPFGSRGRTNQVIRIIKETFRLPDCSRKFPRDIGKDRPCLNFHMDKCDGWCRPEMKQEDYYARLQQAKLLLEGKHSALCDSLRERLLLKRSILSMRHNIGIGCVRLKLLENVSLSLPALCQIPMSSAGIRRRQRRALRCCILSAAI